MEERVAKNKSPYLVVECGDGIKRTCWEQYLFALIKAAAHDGEEVDVAIDKSGTYENIVGINGVTAPEKPGKSRIEKAVNEKNKRITELVDRKQSSMTEFAIRRDAAMFTTSRLGTWKTVTTEMMVEEYKKWRAFFEEEYK